MTLSKGEIPMFFLYPYKEQPLLFVKNPSIGRTSRETNAVRLITLIMQLRRAELFLTEDAVSAATTECQKRTLARRHHLAIRGMWTMRLKHGRWQYLDQLLSLQGFVGNVERHLLLALDRWHHQSNQADRGPINGILVKPINKVLPYFLWTENWPWVLCAGRRSQQIATLPHIWCPIFEPVPLVLSLLCSPSPLNHLFRISEITMVPKRTV